MLAALLTQVLVCVVLLFSPVRYPASRVPEWLQRAHAHLPIGPTVQVVRAGLANADFSVPGRSVVVLGVWCVASVGAALAALRRRA